MTTKFEIVTVCVASYYFGMFMQWVGSWLSGDKK